MRTPIQSIEGNATRDIQHRAGGVPLALRGISRVFDGGVEAIRNLSLDIPAGEFVAILGPSGCGKSTLLRIIAGLDRPTVGNVSAVSASPSSPCPSTLGQGRGEGFYSPRNEASPHPNPLPEYWDRGQDGIAYVFQDAHLLPWRNVLRNVALPLELMGINRVARHRAAEEALEQVGLAEAIGRYPAQLSGGMKMRVSLARALVTRPRLLLLDEPFAALDEINRQKLDERLRQLWLRHRMTIIFVTHSTAEATFLADRAVVLTARPARIVDDLRVDLRAERLGPLRATPEFAAITRKIYEALEKGGA